MDWTTRQHDGVISTTEARDAGVSDSARGRRLTDGRWSRVAPRTYLLRGHRWSPEARLRAATTSTEGTAHGPAAAWWHGLLDELPAVVDVTVPRDRNPRSTPGVRVRRRDLDHRDRVGLRDVWVTDVPLTVLETAVVVGRGSVFLDRALQTRVSLEALHRAHHRNLGRTGSAAAGRLLAAATDATGSEAERVLLRLLRAGGVRGWRRGYRTLGYELDVAFPRARVAVEVDGWAWHHQADRFEHDRERQSALVADGWRVLRCTWHQLHDRPDVVIAQIVATVRAAGG